MATTVTKRPGAKAMSRPGSKAHARMVRMSASKARVVLNLIRGKQVNEAMEILSFSERLASEVIGKCLASAVANAEHNDDLDADELFISACYADGGPTLKRFRPRARGRAGRIHKQTCHITIEVSRYTEEELDRLRASSDLKNEGRQSRSKRGAATGGGDRARRVARSQAAAKAAEEPTSEEPIAEEPTAEDPTAEVVDRETEDTATEVAADPTETVAGTPEIEETEVASEASSDEDQGADGADEKVVADGEADSDAEERN